MLKAIKRGSKILGMNARNLKYIRPHNKKEGTHLADDKLLTKKILRENNIPVPEQYGVLQMRDDIRQFDWEKLPKSFVIKPNFGFGGEGILVVFGRKKDGTWVGAKDNYNFFDFISHIHNILDGNFSLYNTPDIAFFEERIKVHKTLKPYAYKGIPDIRVIVYNNIPVMAMLRLPTKATGGKANLHQGGIGIGIDIATGTTTTAIQWDRVIEIHPDTKLKLSGIKIPYWDDILHMAVKAQRVTNIGYLGIDIVLDKERGPMVLELNARAGLAIQIANVSMLKGRLERVEGLKIKTIERGIRVAKELFGGEIEQEVEQMTGKPMIGMVEKVQFETKEKELQEMDAKIDTGADRTSVSYEVADMLGYSDVLDAFKKYKKKIEEEYDGDREKILEFFTNKAKQTIKKGNVSEIKKVQEIHKDLIAIAVMKAANGITIRPIVRMSLKLGGIKLKTKVGLSDRSHLKYSILIGKRDLKRFLLDPSK